MRASRVVAALLLLPAVACADLGEQLSELNAGLAALASHGPHYPATLDLLRLRALAYARAIEADCAAHQALAAEDARRFMEDPYAALLPSYAVKTLSLDATLAWGRGQCSDSEEELVRETELARDKALEGISLAARSRDYDSEAFLRFQAANYHRILGDADESFALLRSAIALDDAHGLSDDGQENRTILAQWQGLDAVTLPNAPTPAKVRLTFGWHPTHIDMDSTITTTAVVAGKSVARTFDSSGRERLEKRPEGGFRTTIEEITVQSRSALADTDGDARLAQFMQKTTAKMPPLDVAPDGAFVGIVDYDGYAAGVKKAARDWVEAETSAGDPRRSTVEAHLNTLLAGRLSRAAIENAVARSHALSTSIWVGSTLETGQTMTLDLNLPLDGAPPAVVLHRLEFRLDGVAPCTAADTAKPHCVEIEMQASPKDDAIQAIADTLQTQGKGALHYWSDLTLHIVLDPVTLFTYEQDLRRAHYLQLADSETEAESFQSRDRLNYRP